LTVDQMLAFAVVIGMMALFVWGRLRYDLVAVLALLVAIAVGIVPPADAFTGFSDDIVIIVASALITSAAVSKSGLADLAMKRITDWLPTVSRQIGVLAGSIMILSAFVKNIGALSMLIPPAFQIARRTGTSPSQLLMPMSFASLLGGLVTLIGTSPNIIVSRIREETTGEPFRMFDFTAVGLPLAVAGLAFLMVGHRLLPKGRRGAASIEAAFNVQGYTTEVVVPEESPVAGRSAAELAALSGGDVHITALVRGTFKRYRNPTSQIVRPGDHLLLEGDPKELEQLVASAGLRLAHAADEAAVPDDPADEIGVMEAVVTGDSLLVDRTPEKLRLSERFDVHLLAVSRSGERVAQRLKSFRFRAGDLVVLQGNMKLMPEILGQLGCLPLAAREVPIGRRQRRWIPIAALVVAMIAMAFQILPVPVAFFAAASVVVLAGALTTREAYDALDAPVLVTLACLIPVSDAMRTTGATEIISDWLSIGTAALPATASIGLIMVVAMAVTPFLNNAATVLVAGPIAAGLAAKLGYSPDPFLIAVAVGAACDFLTPIGHQCNMLVMGPGGYRFGDYWRLGLPLSVLVVVLGVPLIAVVWPLAPG
jgi:di/tricarboxylate transporter